MRKSLFILVLVLVLSGPVFVARADEKAESAFSAFKSGFESCNRYSDAIVSKSSDAALPFVQLASVLWVITGAEEVRNPRWKEEDAFQLSLAAYCMLKPDQSFGGAAAKLLTGNNDWINLLSRSPMKRSD